DGVQTYDMYKEGVSRRKVGTREVDEADIARVGERPEKLKAVSYKAGEGGEAAFARRMARESVASNKETVGVDIYLDWTGGTADDLGALVSKLSGDGLKLSAIANRGVRVYPDG